MLSTHYREPHSSGPDELALLDRLARRTAPLLLAALPAALAHR